MVTGKKVDMQRDGQKKEAKESEIERYREGIVTKTDTEMHA